MDILRNTGPRLAMRTCSEMEHVPSYLRQASWSAVRFVPELRTAGEVASASAMVTAIAGLESMPVSTAVGDHENATLSRSTGWRRPRVFGVQRARAVSA
jgi:hypothetical protein